MLTRPTNGDALPYTTGTLIPGRTHRQSALGTAGTWTMLGGVVVAVVGYAEVKSATKTFGPFVAVDESKVNAGHAIEILGGGLFTAGLTMIIIDAVYRHSHGDRLGIIAPKNNEIGVAYKF